MSTETKLPTEEQTAERTRAGRVYRPNVDILETTDELTLIADVPGATGDAIDIDFDEGILTVQARVNPRGEDRNDLLREYGVGDFYRTFRLSERINAAGIHAECSGGVLTVHLPKVEAAKPRKIEVKTG